MTEVIANFTISWNKEVAIDAINQTGKIPAEVKPAINDAIENISVPSGCLSIFSMYCWKDNEFVSCFSYEKQPKVSKNKNCML